MQEQLALLVSGGTVVAQNPAQNIIAGGAIAIRGSRIVAVGPALELDARYEARRRIDAAGRYVFPGLINTHTRHSAPGLQCRGGRVGRNARGLAGEVSERASNLVR